MELCKWLRRGKGTFTKAEWNEEQILSDMGAYFKTIVIKGTQHGLRDKHINQWNHTELGNALTYGFLAQNWSLCKSLGRA